MRRLFCSTTLAVLATATLQAQEGIAPLVKPGGDYAIVASEHLRAIVPADQAQELRQRIARADTIYVRLAQDAGYEISAPLWLIVSDAVDDHNGFSTTVPRPIIQIELAPSTTRSQLFTGGDDEFERTLIHELVHHIGNDRTHGINGLLENIFGRVFPNDPLSLITALVTVPPHVTMPLFWHEGTAQWAETQYADPGSPWAGRGRDSLTHMVWRLDAAEQAIPEVDDWRSTYHRWPYGNRVYLYGLAYLRWLERHFGSGKGGNKPGVWRILTEQTQTSVFSFDFAPIALLGSTHRPLIERARADLQTEQERQLAQIRTQPVTTLTRLTPVDTLAGAPAWQSDGSLLFGYDDRYSIPSLARITPEGELDTLWCEPATHDRGELRSLPDGTAVFAEQVGQGTNPWARSRVVVREADGDVFVATGERLIQPDISRNWERLSSLGTGHAIAAIQLGPDGTQLLSIGRCHPALFGDHLTEWTTIPTQGRPWHPAFRPGTTTFTPQRVPAPGIPLKPFELNVPDFGDATRHTRIAPDLAWVETDHSGSRLVLAPLAEPTKRTILATVRGRLIHPVWTQDGASLFVCSDVSGVCNAYRIDVTNPGILVPVTNVIGGVIACVPSVDGTQLALVAFDRHGTFIAKIANDPTTFPPTVPAIDLSWPGSITPASGPVTTANHGTTAPGSAELQPGHGTAGLQPGATAIATTTVEPYYGLLHLRPLFWTPTTLATPWGGYGIAALAADPVYTELVSASIGVGPVEHSPVGVLSYTGQSGWISYSLSAWRNERSYYDRVFSTTRPEAFTYSENQTTGQLRLGYGLAGVERRFQIGLAAGITNRNDVPRSTDRFAGQTVVSDPIFTGQERYVEGQLGFSNARLFPTSYTKEDGLSLAVTGRHSGLGGEYQNRRAIASGSYVHSLFPHWGHQVVVGGAVGWSLRRATRYLQNTFSIGGASDLPVLRGYNGTTRTGRYLTAWSAAYRFPIWRPFTDYGTTPFGFHQFVVEGFYDAAKVSNDHIDGDGKWLRSYGGELHVQMLIWALTLNPGIGVAQQVDAKEETQAYFTFDYQW